MEDFITNLKKETLIHDGGGSIVSNINEEIINGPMRGWICGHFFPKGSPFHRNDIEICVKTLPVDMTEEEHYHLCSFEFLLVLKGEVTYNISGKHFHLTPGMYYMLEPGETEHVIEVQSECTILAVRLPSIPQNKIFTKNQKRHDCNE